MTATATKPIEMDEAFLAADKRRFRGTCDIGTLMQQIGRMNFIAISGGRMFYHDHGVILPVGNGYKVTVDYDDVRDEYTVRRIRIQGFRAYLHGEVAGANDENVGEIAYRASCFENGPFGE